MEVLTTGVEKYPSWFYYSFASHNRVGRLSWEGGSLAGRGRGRGRVWLGGGGGSLAGRGRGRVWLVLFGEIKAVYILIQLAV